MLGSYVGIVVERRGVDAGDGAIRAIGSPRGGFLRGTTVLRWEVEGGSACFGSGEGEAIGVEEGLRSIRCTEISLSIRGHLEVTYIPSSWNLVRQS
jgi:hypothetical protein